MNPLEAATSDELVEELRRRYPSLLVAGVRVCPGDENAEEFCHWWFGGITTAIGIADRLKVKMHGAAEANSQPIEGE